MSIYSPENRFYVYAYLRSKDSQIAPSGTPYYIGKGSDRRAYSKNHSIPVPKNRTNIVFLEENLSENKAFEIEIFLIAYYGRKDLKTGSLRNKTDGGEGSSGYICSEETRIKLSAEQIGKTHSEKTKQKLSVINSGKNNPMFGKTGKANSMYGKHHSTETKAKQSAANKGRSYPIVECPHCGKRGKGNTMTRWHFDNCKSLKLVPSSGIEPLSMPCKSMALPLDEEGFEFGVNNGICTHINEDHNLGFYY